MHARWTKASVAPELRSLIWPMPTDFRSPIKPTAQCNIERTGAHHQATPAACVCRYERDSLGKWPALTLYGSCWVDPIPSTTQVPQGEEGDFKSALLTRIERPSFHFCKKKGLPISPRRPKSGVTKPGKVIMRVEPNREDTTPWVSRAGKWRAWWQEQGRLWSAGEGERLQCHWVTQESSFISTLLEQIQ